MRVVVVGGGGGGVGRDCRVGRGEPASDPPRAARLTTINMVNTTTTSAIH